MSMLRNNSNTALNDGPHTLRSGLHSPEISILRPSHHSLSLISNSLEISQSPTRALIQDPQKIQYSILDTQMPSTTASICNTMSSCTPAPPEMPTYPCSTKQEKIKPFSGQLWSATNKIETILEDKNTGGQVLVHSSEILPDPPNPNFTELLHEFSPGVTIPKDNTLSELASQSSCNLVPGPNIFSSSDMPPSPSVCSVSSEQFFSFVIFHAPEDQAIASKVCSLLENLGVGKGTTFCEGFETPGVSPLTCLENAVENSAYIILLLTNAFLETTWVAFQSNTAMMHSIKNAEKLGSVIPFYPHLNKPDVKIPLWIQSLIPLDENSPLFEHKVRQTFKQNVVYKQYKCWSIRMKKTTMGLPHYKQQNISLQWSMGDNTAGLPQAQPPLPVYQTPVIQISHASNVQIGNQNSMNVQFSPNGPQMDFDTNVYQDTKDETPN